VPAARRAGYLARRAPAAGECEPAAGERGYVGAAGLPLTADLGAAFTRVFVETRGSIAVAACPHVSEQILSTNIPPIRTNRTILSFEQVILSFGAGILALLGVSFSNS